MGEFLGKHTPRSLRGESWWRRPRHTSGSTFDRSTLVSSSAPRSFRCLDLPKLRGHLELLADEVEQAAVRLPKDEVLRYCVLACVGEARGRLRISPRPGHSSGVAYARRLARVLNALCDHYENLSSNDT
jgi:hypothetical protein